MSDDQSNSKSKRMPKHCVEHNVHIWKLLRAPFILPTDTCKTCEWESIDVDLYGCCTCGKMHFCEYGSCQTVESEDALVCSLSGLVVYTKRFVETEFVDTVCIFGKEISDVHESMHAQVDTIISSILYSKNKNRFRTTLLSRCLKKSSDACLRNVRQTQNLMLKCMLLLQNFQKMQYIFTYMSKPKRRELTNNVVTNCVKMFRFLAQNGMSIKSYEVQRLAVGVLYLMRHGVYNKNIVVLQRTPELQMMLPPESALFDQYGVHPKYITEMENRLKFCLRNSNK